MNCYNLATAQGVRTHGNQHWTKPKITSHNQENSATLSQIQPNEVRLTINAFTQKNNHVISILGWKRSCGGQAIMWHGRMNESTKRLATVSSCRLPGRGPKDPQHAWLNTVEDMDSNRCQCQCPCCNFLIEPWNRKNNPCYLILLLFSN